MNVDVLSLWKGVPIPNFRYGQVTFISSLFFDLLGFCIVFLSVFK